MAVRYQSGWACTYLVAEAEQQMPMSDTAGKKKGFYLSKQSQAARH